MNTNNNQILSAWNKVISEKSVWEHLKIKDSAFYFEKDDMEIFLSSFKTKDLPQKSIHTYIKRKDTYKIKYIC